MALPLALALAGDLVVGRAVEDRARRLGSLPGQGTKVLWSRTSNMAGLGFYGPEIELEPKGLVDRRLGIWNAR